MSQVHEEYQEPTPEQQEAYWDISSRAAHARHELYQLEVGFRATGIHDRAAHERAILKDRTARRAFDAFLWAHRGYAFRVFRPEDIERAVSEHVKPIRFAFTWGSADDDQRDI